MTAILIVLSPLLGLVANLIFGNRLREPLTGWLATAAAGLAFAFSLTLLRDPTSETVVIGTWLQVSDLSIPLAFRIDTLSITMALVVTGVGTLIHAYSVGYMHGDPRFTRFFIYLNLFLVAMLVLVLADNLAVMFIGWEGVGLCSYLLIGFWFDGETGVRNSNAARKAFIVNRVGDFGLLMSMFIAYHHFGTLDFAGIFAALDTANPATLNALALFMLLGVAGKSAQIPLYVWLPDAMAGPTPASALIHAATMVTSGIYLIVRMGALFALAPLAQTVTVWAGMLTALVAALIAVGQFDIKRVLAYSTVSQLGFMVAAAGMGAYVAAMFHLVTHAFFKSLLFMAAGSVIHGVEHHNEDATLDPQDMRGMGGLARRMPLTFAAYIAGALALAGVPPLAGFFSKDEILAAASGWGVLVYAVLSIAAFLTAFYIGRQVWLVFFGAPRSEAAEKATESSRTMTVPLLVLAALAAVGGLLNLPHNHMLLTWLEHTLGGGEHAAFHMTIAVTSTVIALAGLGMASWLYGAKPFTGEDPLAGRLFNALVNKLWVDDAYQVVFVRPYQRLAAWINNGDRMSLRWIEDRIIALTQRAAQGVQFTQTGQLNWNVVGIMMGLLLVFALVMLVGRL